VGHIFTARSGSASLFPVVNWTKAARRWEASLQQLKENEMQLVQSEKTGVARTHERGHHPRNQQSAELRHDGLFTLRNKGKYLAPEQQEDYAEI